MRLSVFWERMTEQFGPLTDSFVRDHVLAELRQRTVHQALAQGEPARDVWRAVCVEMNLPARMR